MTEKDARQNPGATPPASAPPAGAELEIRRRIREKGPITFREFMETALYWPEGGYYTSQSNRWGHGGDYITNLDISPVFPRVMARQIIGMWEALGSPPDFHLMEAGAGRGLLSKGIFSSLKELSPGLFRAIKITLVEKNKNLHGPPSSQINWLSDISEAAPASFGCILTNELIDSLPVHRVIQDRGLKELYVGLRPGFVEIPGPPSTPELEAYLKDANVELAEGQRAEVNLEARRWLVKAAALIGAGFILTIDYGLPAREMYAPERGPTLHCHFRHTLNNDPFRNIGAQDMTAFVDFTSFAAQGERLGLSTVGFTTQKNFLLGLGILDELQDPGELELADYDKIKNNQGIKELIMPGSVGDDFKVLIQYKGPGPAPFLKGFSFRDLKGRL